MLNLVVRLLLTMSNINQNTHLVDESVIPLTKEQTGLDNIPDFYYALIERHQGKVSMFPKQDNRIGDNRERAVMAIMYCTNCKCIFYSVENISNHFMEQCKHYFVTNVLNPRSILLLILPFHIIKRDDRKFLGKLIKPEWIRMAENAEPKLIDLINVGIEALSHLNFENHGDMSRYILSIQNPTVWPHSTIFSIIVSVTLQRIIALGNMRVPWYPYSVTAMETIYVKDLNTIHCEIHRRHNGELAFHLFDCNICTDIHLTRIDALKHENTHNTQLQLEAFPQGNHIPTYGRLCGNNVRTIHTNAFTERKIVFITEDANLFSNNFNWNLVTFTSSFDGKLVVGDYFVIHIKNNMREQLKRPDIVNRNFIYVFKSYMERIRTYNLMQVVGDAI